jgi:ribosomal protein S18 acetylase RimI-like enzyme
MPIELNALETTRFGVIAARVVDIGASTEAIDVSARNKCVQMLTARIPASDLSRVHEFEAAGYRLMDTLVYYTRDLGDLPPRLSPPEGLSSRLASPKDAGAVACVARAGFAGYMGHYHADPRLEKSAADAAYVEWAETNTARTSSTSPVLVTESNGTIMGFLSLRTNSPDEMEIILNAVKPAFQGRGTYGALVSEAIALASALGCSRIITSTQINNYRAQRVWVRLGFFHSRSVYTFHKWLEQPAKVHPRVEP